MDTRIPPVTGIPHDGMDSFIAALTSFCERLFHPHQSNEAVAFSDEFERKQIAREFHLN